MTQTELAKRVGIIQSSLGQYLRGRAMPALDTFANLCIVLDLDANDILCVEGNRNTVVSNSFNNNSGTISFNG
ncbi:MAG: helix-turn-helix transcriptional regulator [Clostridia bacterium]|nr:helix-turn-helix transcriptional regulator [Clostridia bacterium]